MKQFWSVFTALILLLVFAAGDGAYAATTGKITGRVVDAATGETLPGVNVVIEGTNRGATTDVEGHYIILAVGPGTYTLAASMVGYSRATKRGVRVIADYTTTVDFTLKEATLKMAEVVVVAERPPVEPDKTTSKHVVTVADIEAVPMVRSSTELVSLQPGMALDGSDRIRGSELSRGLEVGYYVDGIQVNRGTLSDVNTSAIQEVAVLTGGMNAEFGNAMAGVVTLITREGQQNYDGRLEYRFTPRGKRHWGTNLYDSPAHKDKMKWNDPDWVNEKDPVTGDLIHVRSDYTKHTGHRVEGNLSGPLASNFSFFVSSTYGRSASRLPSAAPTSLFNTRNLVTLTFRPSGDLKVKVGGLFERHKRYYVRDNNLEGVAKNMHGVSSYSGRNIFIPENWSASGKQKLTDDMFHLTMTHSLGAKTYYEARLYTVGSNRDPYEVPDKTEPVRTDADGWFFLPRKIRAYHEYHRRYYGFKFDFTSQATRSHLFQAGLDYKRYNFWETEFIQSRPGYRALTFTGKDYELGKGVTPWEASAYVQDKLEYGGLIVNAGVRWDYFNYGRNKRQVTGIELAPMYRMFTHRKYELEHMEPGSPTISSLSPRVGISHPINDRLAAHYFIGRFHTILPMSEMFQLSYMSKTQDRDVNGNGKIDEAEKFNTMDALSHAQSYTRRHATEGVKPERATSVEMGVDWNFVSDYTTSITAHYRLDEGMYGRNSINYWEGPKKKTSQITLLRNAVWTSSRGIEMSLRKTFSHNFSFRVAYDMQWLHGIGYGGSREHYGMWESNWYLIPDSKYIASGRYWYDWEAQPDGSEKPKPLTPDEIQSLGKKADEILASWRDRAGTPYAEGTYREPRKVNDAGLWVVGTSVGSLPAPRGHTRRNQLSVQFFYATPMDYGPHVWGIRPFGGLRVSSVYRMFSGNPFEYFPPEGPSEWKQQSPAMRTDLHVEKDFQKLGGLQPALFLEVTNLFNEKNTSSRSFAFVQYGLKEPAPDDPDYLQYGDTAEWRRNRWDPRLIQVGLTLSF